MLCSITTLYLAVRMELIPLNFSTVWNAMKVSLHLPKIMKRWLQYFRKVKSYWQLFMDQEILKRFPILRFFVSRKSWRNISSPVSVMSVKTHTLYSVIKKEMVNMMKIANPLQTDTCCNTRPFVHNPPTTTNLLPWYCTIHSDVIKYSTLPWCYSAFIGYNNYHQFYKYQTYHHI